MAEFKPCPFCGARPEDVDVGPKCVECPSCGIQGPTSLTGVRDAVIAAWNWRADPVDGQVAKSEAFAKVAERISSMPDAEFAEKMHAADSHPLMRADAPAVEPVALTDQQIDQINCAMWASCPLDLPQGRAFARAIERAIWATQGAQPPAPESEAAMPLALICDQGGELVAQWVVEDPDMHVEPGDHLYARHPGRPLEVAERAELTDEQCDAIIRPIYGSAGTEQERRLVRAALVRASDAKEPT